MKQPNKKAQVYGLSSFIYALAIAVVLLIGLIGMAKDFQTHSQSASYRHDVTMVTRSAETVKKLMEQERGYALDKSLFITGVQGGVQESVLNPWACGSKLNQSISYLPEYVVTYWQKYGTVCIPSDEQTLDSVEQLAQNYFSEPDSTILTALSNMAGKIYDFTYTMKITDHSKNNFEVNWFATGTVNEEGVKTPLDKISFMYPPGKNTIEYSFDPFVHTISNLPLFKIKDEAANFVNTKEVDNWLNSEYSPIINYIDEDFITEKVWFNEKCVKPAKCGDYMYINGVQSCADVGCGTTCWVLNQRADGSYANSGCTSFSDVCVGATNKVTDKPMGSQCGDFCFYNPTQQGATTANKCLGATYNYTSSQGNCAAIGCKTSCWGEYSSGGTSYLPLKGCTTNSPDVCVGSTGSTSDAPNFASLKTEEKCELAKADWQVERIEHDCITDPTNPEYCTQDLTDLHTSFKSLVEYAKTIPNTPNECNLDNSIYINNNYEFPGTCTIYTKRNSDGKLVIDTTAATDGFSGTCTSTGVHSELMKCVMKRMINNLNTQLPEPKFNFESGLDWKTEFYTFNLTYNGVQSPYKEYNTSEGEFVSCSAGTPKITRCGEYCTDCTGSLGVARTNKPTINLNEKLQVSSCISVGCKDFTPEPLFDTDRCVGTTTGRDGFLDEQASQCSAITDLESCITAGCIPVRN